MCAWTINVIAVGSVQYKAHKHRAAFISLKAQTQPSLFLWAQQRGQKHKEITGTQQGDDVQHRETLFTQLNVLHIVALLNGAGAPVIFSSVGSDGAFT